MSRIALIAPTGMLGSAVYDVLKDRHELILVYRDESRLELLERTYGKSSARGVRFDLAALRDDFLRGFTTQSIAPSLAALVDGIGEVDGVVNAAGVIKPYSLVDPFMTLFINGTVPHLLAAAYGSRLIQITTDCAFSGLDGAPYTEDSPHSPNDLYGLSKSIGEPSGRSLVLRTSIIGPEIHGFVSLVAWVKFGRVVDEIVSHRGRYPDHGLFHIFSTAVTKYEMVTAIAKKYDVKAMITPDNGPALDRRLATVKDLNGALRVPSFGDMLADM
ncbi:MAG: sugar nucleotide-binding protein [Candidatus Eisenbacteria bacterium]|uniref:dTDP-4-dehydrorhamnose reductase n=1 Tax=Eiseniibacteriota bacterium TaxID=2212470 RepID=A0A538TVV1_UNCEI|nr:MAG: sugar nucleotide-binding protein [Candidatus Eisenbacteria bacterium]